MIIMDVGHCERILACTDPKSLETAMNLPGNILIVDVARIVPEKYKIATMKEASIMSERILRHLQEYAPKQVKKWIRLMG